jgi:hypothetical protein
MSITTIETARYIYKKVYSTRKIADLTERDHVWYAKIHKEGGFDGDGFKYTIPYGAPQGVSGTFSNARANASPSSGAQLEAYSTDKFGVIKLNGKAVLASRGKKGAFYDLLTRETNLILMEVGDSNAFDFYRNTYGTRGRISAINGNVLTLEEPSHVRHFKKNMVLQADDVATGASPRTGTTFVTAVSAKAGTITVDDAADITSLTVGDYLFRDGDAGTCMEGLQVCTPLAEPVLGVDDFRGIDRGAHPDLLAGSRLDDTELNAEVALMRLAVDISLNGRSHMVDEAYVHPIHFFNMSQRLGAKVEYDNGGGTANVGFQFIMLHTAAGSFKVFADPDCPMEEGRVSKTGTQYLKYLGNGMPHIIDLDGNMTLRMTDDNGLETRVESFHNLIQDDTAAQGVCSLATT